MGVDLLDLAVQSPRLQRASLRLCPPWRQGPLHQISEKSCKSDEVHRSEPATSLREDCEVVRARQLIFPSKGNLAPQADRVGWKIL
jgi:hypothetical protein